MKTAPQIEGEAAQLNRDYAIHKKNYEDLVARREAASMSGELEAANGVADFRLIDPPRSSSQPVAPNRTLLMPLALVAGLAAGLFMAFAMSQLRPVFHDPRSLRAVTQMPLLGVVTMVLSDEGRSQVRSNLIRFIAASTSLFLVFGIGLAVMAFIAAQAK